MMSQWNSRDAYETQQRTRQANDTARAARGIESMGKGQRRTSALAWSSLGVAVLSLAVAVVALLTSR